MLVCSKILLLLFPPSSSVHSVLLNETSRLCLILRRWLIRVTERGGAVMQPSSSQEGTEGTGAKKEKEEEEDWVQQWEEVVMFRYLFLMRGIVQRWAWGKANEDTKHRVETVPRGGRPMRETCIDDRKEFCGLLVRAVHRLGFRHDGEDQESRIENELVLEEVARMPEKQNEEERDKGGRAKGEMKNRRMMDMFLDCLCDFLWTEQGR